MNDFVTSTPKEINQIEKIREQVKKWTQSGNQSDTTFSCPSNIDDFAACDATSNPVGCYCIINESVHHLALLIGTNDCD